MLIDMELLAAWRSGDASAGKTLFQRYFPAVTRFFINKVPQDHEDLVQETFMACARGRDGLRDDGRFRSYLFGTAFNVLKSYYTRKAVRGRAEETFDQSAAADLVPGPSTLLRKAGRDRALLEALRRIPLEQQIVLEMIYWEEMSSVEVAEAIGVTDTTVRTRAHRGRARLIELLASETPQPLELETLELDAWAARVRALVVAELG